MKQKDIIPFADTLLQIGSNLKALRHSRKETIKGVASATNINLSVISQLENGKYTGLKVQLLIRIAEYYNTTAAELFKP